MWHPALPDTNISLSPTWNPSTKSLENTLLMQGSGRGACSWSLQTLSAILSTMQVPCSSNKNQQIWWTDVTDPLCPSPEQAENDQVADLKRRTWHYADQRLTSDDTAGLSYLESADAYEYNTLAIGRLIVQ
jgi:hypothetical protein